MRILFAGSPKSSAKILNSLANDGLDIVGAISQPDKRSRRGKGKEESPVSSQALKLGIKTQIDDIAAAEKKAETQTDAVKSIVEQIVKKPKRPPAEPGGAGDGILDGA